MGKNCGNCYNFKFEKRYSTAICGGYCTAKQAEIRCTCSPDTQCEKWVYSGAKSCKCRRCAKFLQGCCLDPVDCNRFEQRIDGKFYVPNGNKNESIQINDMYGLCCNCVNFDRTEQNDKTCFGICKAKGTLGAFMVCTSCRDGKTKCLKFQCKSANTKADYYNGKSCLNHIENFFAFHEFLSPYEIFYIGNIIKYLWRYKKKNGVKDLEKAKQYLDYLIEETKGSDNK